jgi:transposase
VHLLEADEEDPGPDAIRCYGLLRNDTGRVRVRLVGDRPVGDVTVQFLSWACEALAGGGKKVLIVVWDEASRHRADAVSAWVRQHNERVRGGGGVELVTCELPVASPWLNTIEPCWTHAKEAIMYPGRRPTAREVTSRVCEPFGCELLPYLQAQPVSETAGTNAPPVGP